MATTVQKIRQRWEFGSLKDAINHAKNYGGRIASDGSRHFWYDATYLPTEIILDVPLKNCEICTWSGAVELMESGIL